MKRLIFALAALVSVGLVLASGRTSAQIGVTPGSLAPPVIVTPASAMNGAGAILGKITSYNGLTTAGNGVPSIVAVGRSTAQTTAVASVATFTPAADGTFEVSGNVNCTTATTYAFALQVTYTDEGNTARTVSLPITTPGGALAPANTSQIVNTSAGPYMGLPTHIRAKGGTAITILTTGTFTTVTYNVEAVIKQTA